MQLLRRVEKHEDFFRPHPDGPNLDSYEAMLQKHKGHAFPDVEAVFPATEVQKDILKEDVQWAEAVIFSGKPSLFGREKASDVWKTLAYNYVCLRSYIADDPVSGQPQVVVLRRVESVKWLRPQEKDQKGHGIPAFVTVESAKHFNGINLVLHFHRALVDLTSLHTIRLNCALLIHGLPGIETTGFSTYIRYLEEQRKNNESSKEYWATTFSDAVPQSVFELNSSVSARDSQDRHGISAVINGADLTKLNNSLEKFQGGTKSSRQTFFELIWARVISAHIGSDEVMFATVRRDGNFIGSDMCVGCLDQTYPIRLRVAESEELSFSDASNLLKDYHKEAGRHAFLGYDEIQKHAPYIASLETAVTYSQTTNNPCIGPRLRRFPVVLCINDASTLRVTAKCTADIPLEDIEVVLKHFVSGILSAASNLSLDDDFPMSNIQLVSESERNLLLSQSRNNRTITPTTIPALFEQAVSLHPDKVAVDFEGTMSLSFAELNKQANRLARRLQLKRGSIYPILSERSLDLVTAILAVLKSGAAYTVLDPDAPFDRLKQIISDCNAPAVLASLKHIGAVPNTISIQNSLASETEDGDNLNVQIDPEDLCYVIYTSGSTGKPKGALLSHKAATSGMQHHSLNGLDRWLLFYNPSFSAAQRTILSTLVHGGTLVLARKETLTGDLAKVINRLSIDSLGITPSALSLLKPEDVPHLKNITLVGEQIPQDLVNIWSKKKGATLRNTYGLSECTQLNFGRVLRSSEGETVNPRVVSPPVDTTDVYILRQGTQELSPLLIPGELCLSGPQLAKGYINQPELTDRVFVDNSFGPGKLYRTGDKARWLSNGQIEILGRVDLQVKINGQKVEPAEVDSLLSGVEGITSSVTLAVNVEDRNILAAGIVLADGCSFRTTVKAAREYLASKLPAYMVPSIWFPLEDIPRNNNGKLNYHLLRSRAKELGFAGFANMMRDDATDDSAHVLDEVESKVATSWATVLGIQLHIIRPSHSFADLGGSSLQAIRAVSELRQSGLAIELGDLLSDISLGDVAAKARAVDIDDQDPTPFSLITDNRLASELKQDQNVTDAYPVTPFQETMLASVNSPDDPYTYSRVWDVTGLDIARLKTSFEKVFRNRELLRTVFVAHKRSFVQTVRNDMELPWNEASMPVGAVTSDSKLHQWDMNKPLWKATVTADKALVITMHHSLFDFWSHRFLYDDVSAAYLDNSVPQRPNFSNFVRYLQKEVVSSDEARSFWSDYLQDVDVIKLNHSPMAQTHKIEMDLGYSITESAKMVGLTVGAVVYSAWAIILSRHLGTEDVVFATTVSGREVPVPDIQNIDGPTMSTVPQRIRLDSNSTLQETAKNSVSGFAKLLKYSQVGMLNALKAQNLAPQSIDTLVNILVGMNDRQESNNASESVFKMRGSRPQWSSGSDMTVLEVEETGGPTATTTLRLAGNMEAQRLEFLKDSLAKLLNMFLEKPDLVLEYVDIMGTAEHDMLYNKLSNRLTLREPHPEYLHSAFERIAHARPDTVAINFNNETEVSYGTLNKLANRFARTLIETGLQPGYLVPLLLDKSVDMIVAILGVMKAGGAYVPLSPDNPTQRNAYIVSDAGAKIAVVHSRYGEFADHVKETLGVKPLMIQDHDLGSAEDLTADDETAPAIYSSPDSLAYLIYTSGSTGMPKGVKVPHRTAAAAVTSMAKIEGRYEGTWRTLQFANYVFDASVQDFFNTLSTGGTLCMAPTDVLLSDMVGCINRMDARQSIITPTVAKLFSPSDVPRFETLIVGGEPLTLDVISKWAPHCKVLNVYGPTETSMVVCTKDVKWNPEPGAQRAGNIGAPFDTVMAFIVDPKGETLLPYGAVGELCIGGPQVTDGYMNRPDLTDSTFVHSNVLNTRIYRTGDLARWLPGGEIECLGRKDNQVKIHGHRIELGEVENAIRGSGLVQDAVALAVDFQGKTHLVAFCVFNEKFPVDANSTLVDSPRFREIVADLREKLGSLATYMLPKYVIPMITFPKLPSRKVDRKTLRGSVVELDRDVIAKCVLESPNEGHTVIPVETEAEVALESAWAEIFSISTDQIGREANFLTLGGDSISAISLTSHVRQTGYVLTVLDILKSPKLKDMAASMRKMAVASTLQKKVFEVPDLVKKTAESKGLMWDDDVEYAYPCPPGQAEFLSQGDRDSQMWVLQTVRRMSGKMNPDDWIKATMRLSQINDILRTTWLQVSPGDWVGVVLRDPHMNITTVSLDSEGEISQFLEDFWDTRFTFGRPFIKYAIIKHQDSSWDLVIKMDHAVYDGTLLRVFDDHFGAILKGEAIPPRVEFRDFAQHVFEQDNQAALRFWQDRMTTQSSAGQIIHGQDLSSIVTPRITKSLRKIIDIKGLDRVASQYGVTPSIIFQGAFSLWLAAATSRSDIHFDYLLSGRNVALPDPQSINGTLANFLPFRGTINRDEPMKKFLSTLQDDFWAVTENGLVGLDAIYQAAGLSRETHGNRILFLSQPFDSVGKDDPINQYRWLVMAQSSVRMYQPYALVVEVSKAVGDSHALKIMYDENVFTSNVAATIADDIISYLEKLVNGSG
ncbi:non-ribosomal peptide synthetase [Fusarium longipes]|uniref:Non-ribosomal peptide synthetase n=1 Tax=Fusarium longipes TaxID=694270 RepID=A0A395T9L0_9HYPO|nr:non-ribosomal peptide synthetase [Fusarium longipes]